MVSYLKNCMIRHDHISSARIRMQLKYDLIGKDSYRGVTLSYAFLANQFGHFALGFVPAYVLFYFWPMEKFPVDDPALSAALVISVFWFLFECYNFLKPLLGDKGKYVFQPDWWNVGKDTFVDIWFFVCGAFMLAATASVKTNLWFFPVALLLVLLYFARGWYITKICQQTAEYPFQFRLSQWQFRVAPANQQAVLAIQLAKPQGMHVLMIGPRGCGKTSLAVAMANERSIDGQKCMYTTASKLLTQMHDADAAILQSNPYALATWRSADWLVIDDLHPGEPVLGDFITPAIMQQHLQSRQENISALISRNTIWVLGSDAPGMHMQLSIWLQWLQQIGVHTENIQVLDLSL